MIYENWLHTDLLNTKTDFCLPLKGKISCDVAVIGGGFAGLHAALCLVESGRDVVVLERSICGGSSSGKSGGFLTPATESDLSQLIGLFGIDEAKRIYSIPIQGINLITSTIKKYNINCDLQKQDALYIAISKADIETLKEEAEALKKLGYSSTFYGGKKLQSVHPGNNYHAGLRSGNSYGINSLVYAQELKKVLLKKGVRIYEGTEVHKINGNTAKTHLGSCKAENIIVCIDKMTNEFDNDISKKYYHVQSFLAVSEPLSKSEIKNIFPESNMMCWDTRHEYVHYRIIGNDRLVVGGGSVLTTWYPKHFNSPGIINKVIKDFKIHFPSLEHVKFPYYWNGLIDVTKDLVPIVDYDPKNKSVQYVLGCAGLPFAAFCGDCAAKRIIDKNTEDYSKYFKIDRKFFISEGLQRFLGKPLTFFLSHIYSLTRTRSLQIW